MFPRFRAPPSPPGQAPPKRQGPPRHREQDPVHYTMSRDSCSSHPFRADPPQRAGCSFSGFVLSHLLRGFARAPR
eukprot:3468405-Pyramimonas_sp.AAC.1